MDRKRKISCVTPTVIAESSKKIIDHIPKQPIVHEYKDGRKLPFFYQYIHHVRTSSKSERLNSTCFKTKEEAEIAAKIFWDENRYTSKKIKVNYAEVSLDDIDITVLKANSNTLNASEKSTSKAFQQKIDQKGKISKNVL